MITDKRRRKRRAVRQLVCPACGHSYPDTVAKPLVGPRCKMCRKPLKEIPVDPVSVRLSLAASHASHAALLPDLLYRYGLPVPGQSLGPNGWRTTNPRVLEAWAAIEFRQLRRSRNS
jgi:hypothetical protein